MTKAKSIRLWLTGARVRTLPLAFAPVVVATALAELEHQANIGLALLALVVALSLQVGVNYANDFSDGVRGTDANRVGPVRLTASGAKQPDQVRKAALISFSIAAIAGLAMVLVTSHYWLLLVGALAILAAWFYTGGKSPYGYAGFGEISVFLFFGLVATIGTYFIQTGTISDLSVLVAIANGFYATAVLLVNNIRDLETDQVANKKTLAVRLGRNLSKLVFLVLIWLPILISAYISMLYPSALISLSVLLLVLPVSAIVLTSNTPKDLITALKLTSYAGLLYACGLGLGFWLFATGI